MNDQDLVFMSGLVEIHVDGETVDSAAITDGFVIFFPTNVERWANLGEK